MFHSNTECLDGSTIPNYMIARRSAVKVIKGKCNGGCA